MENPDHTEMCYSCIIISQHKVAFKNWLGWLETCSVSSIKYFKEYVQFKYTTLTSSQLFMLHIQEVHITKLHFQMFQNTV